MVVTKNDHFLNQHPTIPSLEETTISSRTYIVTGKNRPKLVNRFFPLREGGDMQKSIFPRQRKAGVAGKFIKVQKASLSQKYARVGPISSANPIKKRINAILNCLLIEWQPFMYGRLGSEKQPMWVISQWHTLIGDQVYLACLISKGVAEWETRFEPVLKWV